MPNQSHRGNSKLNPNSKKGLSKDHRKQRSRTRGGQLGGNTRSPSSIISNLSNSVATISKLNHPYLKARLDPFSYAAGSVPDGQNQNFICIDMHAADVLSAVPSAFNIQTFPTLPFTMGVRSSSAITVNGEILTARSSNPVWGVNLTTSMYPLGYFGQLAATYAGKNLGVGQQDPWNSNKLRIGVVGYKIIYTGPVSTCAGSITVTPNAVGISPAGAIQATSASTTSWSLVSVSPAGVAGTAAQLNTPLFNCDLGYGQNILTKESKTYRPEETIMILPRYMAKANLPQDIFAGTYPIGTNISTTTNNNQYVNMFTTNNMNGAQSGGIIWYDDNWETFDISFSGINTDATYRIESVVCVETNVQSTSPFAGLTKETEKLNADVMKISEMMNSSVPPVVSTKQHNQVINTLPSKVLQMGSNSKRTSFT